MPRSNRHHSSAVTEATRSARPDGVQTREQILEAAGQLFAERGYADTTSKAICARASVNIAAVNYHFGSRDGLYLKVLGEAHQRVMSLESLRELAASDLPGDLKLKRFYEVMIRALLDQAGWPMRIWAREMLTPSPLVAEVIRTQGQPKFDLLTVIVSEITGMPTDHPQMNSTVFSVVAPCLMLLIVDRRLPTPIQSLYAVPAPELAARLWRFSMAGLAAAGAAWAANGR